MAWEKQMTEKRIKQREYEAKYRLKKRYLQKNRTPEQQEHYRQMWSKYYESHKKEKSERCAKRYQQKREQILKQCAEYRKSNPEVTTKAQLKYLKKIGNSFDYGSKQMKIALISWSKSIRKRDNQLCQVCGDKGTQSHHIFYQKHYPKLALNFNNGITLCNDCHYHVHGRCLN